MINLFVQWYNDPQRDKEFYHCLGVNIDNRHIDKIYLIIEHNSLDSHTLGSFSNAKLHLITHKRCTYNDFFALINKYTKPEDINIVANLDVYFDETIGLLKNVEMEFKCFALSRWDKKRDGSIQHFNRVDSQDAWIFKGMVMPIKGDHFIGKPGCDNRIAFEIQQAGYNITNPSLSIKAIHVHANSSRAYMKDYKNEVVPGPYLTLPPCHL